MKLSEPLPMTNLSKLPALRPSQTNLEPTIESAIESLQRCSCFQDCRMDAVTHSVVIEHWEPSIYDRREFIIHSKPGYAGGHFWKNGDDNRLCFCASLEDAVHKIACTFGLNAIRIDLCKS